MASASHSRANSLGIRRASYVLAFLSGEPRAVFSAAPSLMVSGITLVALSAWLQSSGIVSGMFAIGLSAACRSLGAYRQERGLWMLAALFLLIHGSLYCCFFVFNLLDVLRGAQPLPFGDSIDFLIATALLATTVRFLWRIARDNWALSAGRDTTQEGGAL